MQREAVVVGIVGDGAKHCINRLCGGTAVCKRWNVLGSANVAQPIGTLLGPDGTLYIHCDTSQNASELMLLRGMLLLLCSVHVVLVLNTPSTLDAALLRNLRYLAEAKRALLPGLPASSLYNGPGRCTPIAIFALGRFDTQNSGLGTQSQLEQSLSKQLEELLSSATIASPSLRRPLLALDKTSSCVAISDGRVHAALSSATSAAVRDQLPTRKQVQQHLEAFATHLSTAASRSDKAQQPARGWSPMERSMHRLASALKPEEDASRERCKSALAAARSVASASTNGDDSTAIQSAVHLFYARSGGVHAKQYEHALYEELNDALPSRCSARSLSGRQCIHGPHAIAVEEQTEKDLHDTREKRRLWSYDDYSIRSRTASVGYKRAHGGRRGGATSHSSGASLRRACACGSRVADFEEPFSIAAACALPACDDNCERGELIQLAGIADPPNGDDYSDADTTGEPTDFGQETCNTGSSGFENADPARSAGVKFTFVPIGAASLYDTVQGLHQPGFRRGLNKLAAIRPPIRVTSYAKERQKLNSAPKSKRKAKPKLSIGFEYESPRGERFIARPEHVGMELDEEESKHAGDALLTNDMPLFLPSASGMPEPAQLSRVIIVTPPSSYGSLFSRPEVCVPKRGRHSDVSFSPEAEVELPPDSLIAVVLPFAYPARPCNEESPALAGPGVVREKAVLLAHTAVYSSIT